MNVPTFMGDTKERQVKHMYIPEIISHYLKRERERLREKKGIKQRGAGWVQVGRQYQLAWSGKVFLGR